MRAESTPRWINIALGLWLFISGFAWPHASAQFTNAIVVGLVCAGAAAAAMRVPVFRHVNAALAL